MDYADFVVRARDFVEGTFKVEVTASPVDRTRQALTVRYPAELPGWLRQVERKSISPQRLVQLGKTLAEMLLPGGVREMLLASLELAGQQRGLRLRLVMDDPRLANLPWEYVNADLADGDAQPYGFLALDPRISIVRHEPIPVAPATTRCQRPFRLAVGMSSPNGLPKLNLAAERGFIEQALTEVDGVSATYVEDLTTDGLEDACRGAHLFHFAGHGAFFWEPGNEMYGSGVVFLQGREGDKVPFPVHNLALTLRGCGVRVAVLGGCETGRRDGVNPWSGIAPAMMRAGLPAAVGMQYSVYDSTAIAFTRRFYRAVASGLSLDESVFLGRLGMYNEQEGQGVDWGVPVLYLRSEDGILFPETTQDPGLEESRRRQRLEVSQKVDRLSGSLVGASVERDGPWWLDVAQEIDVVESGAEALGVRLGAGTAGDVRAEQRTRTVRSGGSVVGVSVKGPAGKLGPDADLAVARLTPPPAEGTRY